MMTSLRWIILLFVFAALLGTGVGTALMQRTAPLLSTFARFPHALPLAPDRSLPLPTAPVLAKGLPSQPNTTRLVPPPREIRIPALNVTASIEHVGLDATGAMDVPKDPHNAGWYKYGSTPGSPGNAVLAGHLDSRNGPAIFYNLNRLAPGDIIIVRSTDNQEHRFVVARNVTYTATSFPLEEVFGKTNDTRLNLITCSGEFNRQTKIYSHRTVIVAHHMPAS
jgi:hypothetical protein